MGRCKIGGYLHLVTRLMANGDLGHFTRENPKAPTLMLVTFSRFPSQLNINRAFSYLKRPVVCNICTSRAWFMAM